MSVKKTLFAPNPTVTATVVGEGSVGEAFNLILNNDQKNILAIKVTATNMKIGVASNLSYFCHFVIVGKALKP